jgi:hypothetical protein
MNQSRELGSALTFDYSFLRGSCQAGILIWNKPENEAVVGAKHPQLLHFQDSYHIISIGIIPAEGE